MPRKEFSPGFRLSHLDVLVLVVGLILSVALGVLTWWIGLAIGFVIAHFFLFCNLFRLSRGLELVWSGVLVVLAVGTVVLNIPGWLATFGISLCITTVVVILEMRKTSYHGIGWQWINPGLRDWWESQVRIHGP
jgi:hypothetical protein